MNSVSLKIPPALDRAVAERARRRGVSKSAVLREAIERYLAADTPVLNGSFTDLAQEYLGCVEGAPADLSSNSAYFEEFGR
jgi:Ribbon-helix-helix protein, copG family